MIFIQKRAAPPELIALQNEAKERGLNPKDSYDLLGNPLKKRVLDQLMEEQGYICAYCMRKIPDDHAGSEDIPGASIEHWFPRDPENGEDRNQGLDYNNFLAVCSGNRGPKGTRRKSEWTCDAKRKNKVLIINPLDKNTLRSIWYKSNGEISTTDPQYEDDLYIKLNLNNRSLNIDLPKNRKEALDSVQADIIQVDDEHRLQYCIDLLSKFEAANDSKLPFVGIILWWLKDYIQRNSQKQGAL